VGRVTDADEIFSRLVGDQVEPRREFIVQNAMNVSSLGTGGTYFVSSHIT
jgi:DNA gyrase subunit B